MKMKIIQSVFEKIVATIGSTTTESGGLLFGSREDFIVTRFLFDENAVTTGSTYTFTTKYLNSVIKKWWEEDGLELIGFIHSHPSSFGKLSEPDKRYFDAQFINIPVNKFLTPLVFSAKDAPFKFIPLAYHKNGKVEELELEILPNDFMTQSEPVLIESTTEIPAKKEVPKSQPEIIATEKEIVINFHNKNGNGELQPVIIYVEKEQPKVDDEVIEEQEYITTSAYPEMKMLEDCLVKIFAFSKVYHIFLSLFFSICLCLIISLLPTFYKFISETLLN